MARFEPQTNANSFDSNAKTADLGRICHFLLDLDGTIYLGQQLLPGAQAFIRYLRECGRKYLFFTNNSAKDATQYADKLTAMGIDAAPEHVLTSGEATVRYLLTETPYRRVFAVGTPSFERELLNAGFELGFERAEAVVLAFDKTLTYEKIERACLLLRDGAPYFATNPDKVCPTEYGYIPDCGSMAALLREASGRSPVFVGKPNPAMIRLGMNKLGAVAETTAMVGDRLYTDVQMGHNAGVTSILVLTGETKAEDVATADPQPHYVFASIRELHQALAAFDAHQAKG